MGLDSYVTRSNTAGEYCNNCEYYSNNYCHKFNKEIAPYGWCDIWEPVNEV